MAVPVCGLGTGRLVIHASHPTPPLSCCSTSSFAWSFALPLVWSSAPVGDLHAMPHGRMGVSPECLVCLCCLIDQPP